MKICIKDGCTEHAYGKSLCKKHYHAEYYILHKEKILNGVRNRYINNPEKYKEYAKNHRASNIDRKKAWDSAWVKANPEKHREHGRKYYARNIEKERRRGLKKQKDNPGMTNSRTAKRRAMKLRATPKWANDFFIKEIYHLAELRTKITGFKWHVDHIVPLQSKLVCGLHVENNLRVIPATENIAKGNRYWPEMP